MRPLVVPRSRGQRHAVLYTDASLSGWGACFFDDDGFTTSTGGSWSPEESKLDISVLEARAVRLAFSTLARQLARCRSVDLRVDNTGVEYALRRGGARAEDLNREVGEFFEAHGGVPFATTVGYVKSADNPADAPSRGVYVKRPVRPSATVGAACRTLPQRAIG